MWGGGFYSVLNEVWGPEWKEPVHLKSTNGTGTFFDNTSVVTRWSEHFQKLFDVPGSINHETLESIQQRSTNTCLHKISMMDEIARSISGLKDGKCGSRTNWRTVDNILCLNITRKLH